MININLNKIYNIAILLKLYNLFNISNYLIFIHKKEFKNKQLLNIKNEILKLNCKSFIINSKYISYLFNLLDFKFINSNILVIFIDNMKNFILILNLLDNIKFYYTYNKIFSNIINNKNIKNYNNNLFIIHYIINSLIFNILLLIL